MSKMYFRENSMRNGLIQFVKDYPQVAQKAGVTLSMVENDSREHLKEYKDRLRKAGA